MYVTSRGPLYPEGWGYGEVDRKSLRLSLRGESFDRRGNAEHFRISLANTFDALTRAGKRVIHMIGVPELGVDVRRCLDERPVFARPADPDCDFTPVVR